MVLVVVFHYFEFMEDFVYSEVAINYQSINNSVWQLWGAPQISPMLARYVITPVSTSRDGDDRNLPSVIAKSLRQLGIPNIRGKVETGTHWIRISCG